MVQKNYQVFGLTVKSAIECGDLLPVADAVPQVTISYGDVPDSLQSQEFRTFAQGMHYQSNSVEFLLKLDGVASFVVRNGSEIIVSPEANADFDVLKLFLFGSAFGALLLQRRLLPLHGSAISTSKGAVIFAGDSGYGKSTLAGLFYQRGYNVLSDDVSAITSSNGRPHVLHSFPRILLWADAMRNLGLVSAEYNKAAVRFDKFQLPVSQQPMQEALPVYAIYVLQPSDCAVVTLSPVNGFGKVKALTNNTYRLQFLEHMGLAGWHFEQINMIAQSVRVATVERPKNLLLLDELVDLLEADFN